MNATLTIQLGQLPPLEIITQGDCFPTLWEGSPPEFTKFAEVACLVNKEAHVPIDYCRLGYQLNQLVDLFNQVLSTDPGSILYQDDRGVSMKIEASAQELFANLVWLTITHSPCTAFAELAPYLRFYSPIMDGTGFFYTVFSIFAVRQGMAGLPVNAKAFGQHLDRYEKAIESLLKRFYQVAKTDAIPNGLVMIDSMIQIARLGFEEYKESLEQGLPLPG